MDLGRSGLPQHADQGALSVSAHNRIVDDDEASTFNVLPDRVELEADAQLPQGLRRLDEGASDIGVLHQPLAERDARGLGIADGRGGSGFRGGDDEVCVNRVLLGQLAAHLGPCGVDVLAVELAVGTREVDVFEDAASLARFGEAVRTQTVFVDGDELTGFDVADELSTDDVECRGLRGHDPAVLQPAQRQGSDPVPVTRGVEGVLVHVDQRERAFDMRQQTQRRLGEVLSVFGREELGDQGGVIRGITEGPGAGRLLRGLLDDLRRVVAAGIGHGFEGVEVRQIAVVGQRHGAEWGRPQGGLSVLERR